MSIVRASFSPGTPGTYIRESQLGVIPASLASHDTIYMLGFSATGPKGLTFVGSTQDFTSQFGVSASAASVQLFFDQRAGKGLWFCNVPSMASRAVTIPTVTVGDTYSLTVAGFTVGTIAVTGDTPATLLSRLTTLVNTSLLSLAYLYQGNLRYSGTPTISSSTNVTLGTVAAAATNPTVVDVIQFLNTAFDPSLSQGILIAPEFFQSFSVENCVLLANAMEALASDPNYLWMAIADCSAAVASATTVGAAINLALVEKQQMSSPRGHLCYYMPYWVNGLDTQVPASASVAGLVVRRFRDEGYTQPPAGVTFNVYGVKRPSVAIDDRAQSQLNPKGVNCLRNLTGVGSVVYGARTVSVSPYYKWFTTRVILNVLEGTLRDSARTLVLRTVDGLGALFAQLKQTAATICERMRLAGALYGTTSDEAYLVICDQTNNPAIDLESGVVNVDVLVKPSPLAEFIVFNVGRVFIGQNLAEIAQAGDTSGIKDQSTAPKGDS